MASEPLPSAAKRNVELITQIERQLVERRSRAEQVGDAIAHFFGSLRFIVLHAVALVVWLAWNSGLAGLEPFDPYPFPLLGLVVGVEFILLTTFILMNQKKQSRRQEQWAHLNLQVCLLTEQEVTKNVQMLHLICKHLKLAEPAQDREVSELARATSVSELAKEIDKAQWAKGCIAPFVGMRQRSANEPAALTKFYSDLFGWKFQKAPMPGPEYWLCDTGSDGPGINGAVGVLLLRCNTNREPLTDG